MLWRALSPRFRSVELRYNGATASSLTFGWAARKIAMARSPTSLRSVDYPFRCR
jgi:hypothetical protein